MGFVESESKVGVGSRGIRSRGVGGPGVGGHGIDSLNRESDSGVGVRSQELESTSESGVVSSKSRNSWSRGSSKLYCIHDYANCCEIFIELIAAFNFKNLITAPVPAKKRSVLTLTRAVYRWIYKRVV